MIRPSIQDAVYNQLRHGEHWFLEAAANLRKCMSQAHFESDLQALFTAEVPRLPLNWPDIQFDPSLDYSEAWWLSRYTARVDLVDHCDAQRTPLSADVGYSRFNGRQLERLLCIEPVRLTEKLLENIDFHRLVGRQAETVIARYGAPCLEFDYGSSSRVCGLAVHYAVRRAPGGVVDPPDDQEPLAGAGPG